MLLEVFPRRAEAESKLRRPTWKNFQGILSIRAICVSAIASARYTYLLHLRINVDRRLRDLREDLIRGSFFIERGLKQISL